MATGKNATNKNKPDDGQQGDGQPDGEPKADTKPKKLKESKLSIEARRKKTEPEDNRDRKKIKWETVTLKAIEKGFDGTRRINPGVEFEMKVPLDADGAAILPTWAVFPDEWRAPEPTRLPPGMTPKAGVQGRATQGGVKAEL
jgi:hypothetical protein